MENTIFDIIDIIKILDFKKVLIIGSQRSGTTITGKILSSEINYEYIDEGAINVDDLLLFYKIYFEKESFVMQAPGLTYISHKLPKDIFFIYMNRNFEDIQKSANRISWIEDKYEAGKYFLETDKSWGIKKQIWDKWQKDLLQDRYAELSYESLEIHPLWIKKELRDNFSFKQTEFAEKIAE